jgi:hemin uptake protein HemP
MIPPHVDPPASVPGESPANDDTSNTTIWRSEELLRGTREVFIKHADDMYKLSVTRNGKLILTK